MVLVSPSSSSLQTPNSEAVAPQSRHWLYHPLQTNLTLGNQILLRVLLCVFSFTVGIGYSERHPEPVVERAVVAPLLPQHLLAQLPKGPMPQAPPPPTVRLKAVGDMVLGTNYPRNRLPSPPETLFRAVLPLLQEADLVFGNFESTLTNFGRPSKDASRPNVFVFRTPPSYSQLLRSTGFQVLNIANNHALDFGRQGFQDTAAAIEQQGMQVVGRKDDITYSRLDNGLTVGWVGFSAGTQLNSLQALGSAQSLVRAAQANADMVVVSFHGGAEGTGAMRTRNRTEYFFGENRGNLVEFSRTLIDAGADLVLGHGPHVPRALELYQGKLIAYSLGNFVGYRTLSTQAQLGDSLVLEVELDREGNLLRGKIHPVRLDRNGIPKPTANPATIKLMHRLTRSDFPQTPLTIAPDGVITPQAP